MSGLVFIGINERTILTAASRILERETIRAAKDVQLEDLIRVHHDFARVTAFREMPDGYVSLTTDNAAVRMIVPPLTDVYVIPPEREGS